MRLQLLSDLHLETETVEVEPAPEAELLVLAGDIDSTWSSLDRFADWPVPVVLVAGNHEFDGRDIDAATAELRERCTGLGLAMLERERLVVADDRGRRIRFLGTTRWCDFDAFGAARRAKAMRAGDYFARIARTTRHGVPFDAEATRAEALACGSWLDAELMRPPRRPRADDAADGVARPAPADGWDRTVVVTHFAPSLESADPRFGLQASTASFCNADDERIPRADLWLHGHLHCRSDYLVPRPGGGATRVVCHARGHERRGEADGWQPACVIEV